MSNPDLGCQDTEEKDGDGFQYLLSMISNPQLPPQCLLYLHTVLILSMSDQQHIIDKSDQLSVLCILTIIHHVLV